MGMIPERYPLSANLSLKSAVKIGWHFIVTMAVLVITTLLRNARLAEGHVVVISRKELRHD